MHEDNTRYIELLGVFARFSPELLAVIDTDGVWAAGGYQGAWDGERRVAELDREGVAAEFVFLGDPRAISPLSPQFRHYPQDVVAAGARLPPLRIGRVWEGVGPNLRGRRPVRRGRHGRDARRAAMDRGS
jgi:hypothetical protein